MTKRKIHGPPVDRYLADEFGMTESGARKWADSGSGPPHDRTPGGHRRYDWTEVREWVTARKSEVRGWADERQAHQEAS